MNKPVPVVSIIDAIQAPPEVEITGKKEDGDSVAISSTVSMKKKIKKRTAGVSKITSVSIHNTFVYRDLTDVSFTDDLQRAVGSCTGATERATYVKDDKNTKLYSKQKKSVKKWGFFVQRAHRIQSLVKFPKSSVTKKKYERFLYIPKERKLVVCSMKLEDDYERDDSDVLFRVEWYIYQFFNSCLFGFCELFR
jgi:hypothetical protein